jgi:hypothetical protein
VTGLRPVAAVGAAGVTLAAIASMAALGEAAGDPAAKAPVEAKDNTMAAVAIVLSNLMGVLLSQVSRPVIGMSVFYRFNRCEIQTQHFAQQHVNSGLQQTTRDGKRRRDKVTRSAFI